MQTVTSCDGTSIAFDQSGEGLPIILVGGAMSTRAAAVPLAALLASHFTVLSYDRRGRGDSGDTQPYAVEREVEDIAALIDAAGSSAGIYGMSSGAVLALDAARALASNLTKLALYEPPFIIDHTRPLLPTDYVAHLNELIASGRRGDAVAYFLADAVMADLPADMRAAMIAQTRQSPMWPDLEAVAHTLPYDGAITAAYMVGNPAPLKHWATVTAPTLVMDGGASPAWMRNAVQAITDVLPHAQRRTLEGQTHAVNPEVLAPALVEFFAD